MNAEEKVLPTFAEQRICDRLRRNHTGVSS